ncbi:hypothetical protein XarbCFBP8130_10345 [Xanthomonas arboricola]|uniref:hypothetical protein n=1 Tax=Xanthomonas arboricola TaxID=56448 RepID=UPI000C82E001|nr:hypothetical protein [Xanthomonas arboricola]MBB4709592.1 hypothetical protein [Xanthomonas arboricola]PPT17753.1 hypothetical protein XarCFBP6771_18745 [Xanthomonas arboricola]PPT59886.1 hypothetical protein XarbCFBP8153_05510 [Xanthomonas arboricola]PPT63856.1 hypothetical protein XarbCFBP8130_10345 [Xanthomonas arboricola]SOU12758.1 hypothetical protein LMG19145_03893 [Xanthomonas arboricola pv. fragariae]
MEAALQLPILAHRVCAARYRWHRRCRASMPVRDGLTTVMSNAVPGMHNNRITTAGCRRCRLLALLHMPYDRYVLRDVGNVPMP